MVTGIIPNVSTPGSVINIMCDSQAAIKALESVETTNKLVKETKLALNALSETHHVTINWIKAHVNNKGNEIADRAAKTGRRLKDRTEVPLSQAYIYIKSIIKDLMYKEWNIRWQTAGDCRQTFLFFPCTDASKSKIISKMCRKD